MMKVVIIISIHALRVEGDIGRFTAMSAAVKISIHALRVEGDIEFENFDDILGISIHALRVEGDFIFFAAVILYSGFLSTPSGWRATFGVERNIVKVRISIHALRVEGDVG